MDYNVYYYHFCFYIEVNNTNDMNYASTEKNIWFLWDMLQTDKTNKNIWTQKSIDISFCEMSTLWWNTAPRE